MSFIVGVQVYLQHARNGNSPLIVVEQAVNVVHPDQGENLTLEQMAHLAIQIYAETHKEKMGYVLTAKGKGYACNLFTATGDEGTSKAKEEA